MIRKMGEAGMVGVMMAVWVAAEVVIIVATVALMVGEGMEKWVERKRMKEVVEKSRA